ncbi:MAG: hypothetical protein CMG07_02210 [Candidatus Marinimicrobia bacterium]|nr:hypothetical protein [Candidatus Neomarinimicrobiota bacterium]
MLFNLTLNNFSFDKSYKDFSLYSEFINKKIIKKDSVNLIYYKNSNLQKKIQQNIKKRDLNIQFSNFDFPFTISALNLFLLMIITFLIFFISLINIFRNKVEFINFSEEILKYYILKLSNIKYLPKNIYFNNSSWKYKPLWTYIAEKKGINIVVYFYSLSELEYKNNFDYKILQGHNSLCWNNYFSWNKEHSNYLKQISKVTPKIIEKKPFSLRDSDPSILNNFDFSNTIAIFDAAPYKKIFSDTFAMYSSEYRCYENVLSFLRDIDYLSNKYNLKIIYKTKKSNKRQISKFFLNHLKKLTDNPNFMLINDSISPKNYINKCLCSISYPFTSTAHFNEDKSKSIYYDPTGNIYLDDIGAHGINIINDKNKLDSFLYDIISK